MPALGQVYKAAAPAVAPVLDLLARRRGLNNATATVTAGADTAGRRIDDASGVAIGRQDATLGRQEQIYKDAVARQDPYAGTGVDAVTRYRDLVDNPVNFDPASVMKEPGYQFAIDQAFNATDRISRSTGQASNGGQVRRQQRNILDVATTRYNDAFNRFMATQQDRKDTLRGGVTIGQNANTSIDAAGTRFEGDLGANADKAGSLGVNAAEDQAALELAKARAVATNQAQGANNTANTIGKLADAVPGILDLFSKAAPAAGTIAGTGLGYSGTLAAGIPGLIAPAPAVVTGGIAGTGAAGAAAGAAPATGLTGALGLGGGSGMFGLGAATIPVVGGIIAGGALLAKHYVGAGRKQADKLTGEGGLQRAFESTLDDIDSASGYTAAQKWESKVQAYAELEKRVLEFARKGKNQRKVARQMFAQISPLFGKPNPLAA